MSLVTLVLVGNALVGERGLIVLIRSNQQLSAVSELIGSLQEENDGLREEVRLLREEPRRIEELARRDLGLIEPGEKVFILRAPLGPLDQTHPPDPGAIASDPD